jgi:hypothetical protein
MTCRTRRRLGASKGFMMVLGCRAGVHLRRPPEFFGD